MIKIKEMFECCFYLFFGYFANLLGGADLLLKSLLLVMVLDFITGIMKSVMTKGLSSKVCFKVILKKISILVLVVLSSILQKLTNNSCPVRDIIVMFFICNDGISILENTATFVPIPKKLRDVLEQLKGETK